MSESDFDDLTSEQVLAYAKAQAATIPPNWGKDWMSESARDLMRIAVSFGGFDFKDLALRLTKVKSRSETINARTVERVLSQMKREADLARQTSRGHAHSTRKIAPAAEALRASETAKRRSDEVYNAIEHRAAAKAHQRAMRLHKTDPAGAGVAWLHDLAAINHRQAATARASRALNAADPTRTAKIFAAFKEKLSAANENTYMAQEYARQALAAARKRV